MQRFETKFLAIHCSATEPDQDIGVREIRKWHVEDNDWSDIGYHFVIRRDGSLEIGRPIEDVGAHVKGFNAVSIGICMVGGLNYNGDPEDNFTEAQYRTLTTLVYVLTKTYPGSKAKGHRDFSPDVNHDGVITPDEWLKACPCFDVKEKLAPEWV